MKLAWGNISEITYFLYRLTRVVPDRGPLHGCMYVILFIIIKSDLIMIVL